MKNFFKKSGSAAGNVASTAIGIVGNASRSARDVMPSSDTVKRTAGQAMIAGGKLLIDPRGAVGEMAVSFGTALVAESSPDWLLFRETDSGFVLLYRGAKAQSQLLYDEAVRSEASVFLCQVMASHIGPVPELKGGTCRKFE